MIVVAFFLVVAGFAMIVLYNQAGANASINFDPFHQLSVWLHDTVNYVTGPEGLWVVVLVGIAALIGAYWAMRRGGGGHH